MPECIRVQPTLVLSSAEFVATSMARQKGVSMQYCLHSPIVLKAACATAAQLRCELSLAVGECMGTPAAAAAVFSALVAPHSVLACWTQPYTAGAKGGRGVAGGELGSGVKGGN